MMLRRLASIALMILAGMSGCATKTPSSGNLVTNAPTNFLATLATDAALQITHIFPPAKTRLALQQPANDPFGTILINDLRAKGYALQENAASVPLPSATNTLQLHYLVDQTQENGLYRTTLQIGEQTLSRAYVLNNGALSPAGAWSRKEQAR